MTLARFRECLPLLLAHEGGYVDDKADPGGATNLGVTLATARAYHLDLDHDGDIDRADVRALKPDDVAPVYYRGYWLASSAEKCPRGLDYMVFDAAVNQGVSRAVRWLQAVVGVAPDGVVGPRTIAALGIVNRAMAIAFYADMREDHYRSLKTFGRFGKGWLRRLREAEAKAQEWAK